MKLVSLLLGRLLGRWSCHHRWVRARWADGSYGLRCAQCMKPYPRTWNQLIAPVIAPVPPPPPGRVARKLKRAA